MSIEMVSMCQNRAELEEPTTYTYISNQAWGSCFSQKGENATWNKHFRYIVEWWQRKEKKRKTKGNIRNPWTTSNTALPAVNETWWRLHRDIHWQCSLASKQRWLSSPLRYPSRRTDLYSGSWNRPTTDLMSVIVLSQLACIHLRIGLSCQLACPLVYHGWPVN